MLTPQSTELDHELERRVEQLAIGLSYRDGWTFTAHDAAVEVRWEVPDVNGGAPVYLAGRVSTPPWGVVNEAELDETLRRLLFDLWELVSQLEAHERLELLKFDGRRLWNPHPDGVDSFAYSPPYGAPLPAALRSRS